MPSIDLSEITAEVTDIKDAGDAIIAAFQGIAAQLDTLPATQTAIDALAAEIRTEATAMKNAILAGTPAEQPPV